MKASTVKNITSRKRKWLRRILITLAVIILLPIALFSIGYLNKDTIIQSLQEWYSENNSGTLTIGSVNTNFISGFPKVGFTLKDIRQTNTDTIADQFSSVQIEEARLTIGAGDLLSGDIKFEKIYIKNAVINSEVRATKSLAYYERLRRHKKYTPFRLPVWLNKKGVKFTLDHVTYRSKDSILNKHFNLEIHKIKGHFSGNDLALNGSAFMDITVHNLGFNTKKGSYFNGARASGNLKFTMDLKNNSIAIQKFPLHIDKQTFQLIANFELSEANSFHFELQNPRTDFNAVKGLLTDSLAVKIKNYDIQKPFFTRLDLSGSFNYGNDPNVRVDFSTDHNDVIIADKFNFKNTAFTGYLTTDIYETDSMRLAKKTGKDVKIAFDSIQADLEDIHIEAHDAYYQSTPEALNFVKANLHLKGSNEALAKVIETDNFDFKGGRFQLGADISGNISSVYQFLNKATGTFKLTNTRIVLKKNGLQLPIELIDLTLDRDHSTLNKLVVTLPNDEPLLLRGNLKNISGIISKSPTTPTTSHILIDSKNLNVNEVISLSKSFLPQSDAAMDDRKTLHETLETIYSQFHPQFSINLEALEYNGVTITDLKSNIDLVNSETILLHNFDFNYDDATTNLKGRVIVHGPESQWKDAIFMDAEATSSGPISVFRDLFNITLFRIDDGQYRFHGNVTGNVKEFDALLNNTQGNLNLTNAKLYYAPAESDIIIDSLSLYVNHSDIVLDQFKLEAGELNPINLSGSIKQFPSFLLDTKTKSGSIDLNIQAPYFDANDLLSAIRSLKSDDSIKNPNNRKALHSIFKDINTFNPTIRLAIDSLKYDDLITEDIKAQLNFKNDSILSLNHLDLRYKSTIAAIRGKVNAHTSQYKLSDNNPFDLDFTVNVKGKSQDLNDYLKTTNFIFKSGDFEFTGTYEAQSEDLDILNYKTFGDLKISRTLVDYKAAELEIPIDSLHLQINDDLATLKTLDIDLPGKSSVEFSGTIDHFSDFINGTKAPDLYSSNFAIRSPYLDIADITEFLENTGSKKQPKAGGDFNLKKFKSALLKINSSFNPTVDMSIDTLRHKNFNVTDFGLELLFDKQDNFKIEDTQLDFYGGSVAMTMEVGLKDALETPISIDMQATNVNLHELVTRFDYFNDDDLRATDTIEGQLNYHLKATGTLDATGKVNMASLNGTLELDLQDLALYNYRPIMENSVLMKDSRFEKLRFRPIVQKLEIKSGELIIPRTEIQSSAIQVFVEGRLKFNDYMNVWLSVPWKNLKSNNGLTLPEKTSYENAGAKFYVELVKDETHDKDKTQKMKVKFRLSNRKLRKQQNTH